MTPFGEHFTMRFIILLCTFLMSTTTAYGVCMADEMRQFLLGEYARLCRIQSVPEGNIRCVVEKAQGVPLSYFKDSNGIDIPCVEESKLQDEILHALGPCFDDMRPIGEPYIPSEQKSIQPSQSESDIAYQQPADPTDGPSLVVNSRRLHKQHTKTLKDINVSIKKSYDPSCFSGRHGCCTVINLGISPRCFEAYCPNVPSDILCVSPKK